VLAAVELRRKVVAEALGTALLLATVVGSGIMGEQLSGGNVGLALLANTLATGAALVALILSFGPISGAHFNPVVTLSLASQGELPWGQVPSYIAAQVIGAFAGVASAHLMFGYTLFSVSQHQRSGVAQVACSDPDLLQGTPQRCTARGRRLHHRGLLVHLIHFLCQPRGDIGEGRE
jgi:glycerol uptake facilitator-like aquaporin